MRRTVVLQHDPPSGLRHFDWLIQRREDPQAPVLTFRLAVRPDLPVLLVFAAERIADHRAFYLDHQGPVPGGRGTVVRVASGVVSDLVETSAAVRLGADFGRGAEAFVGLQVSGDRWLFERAERAHAAGD